MSDCPFRLDSETNLWTCQQCGWVYPRQSEKPPRRNCPSAKKKSRGLGDTIAKITSAVGIKPCGGCKKRQKKLNKWFPYKDKDKQVIGTETPPDLPEVDAVIPLGNGCGWGDYEELRYALRSLETNLIGLRNVFVVGGKPEWLSSNAIHIPAEDIHKRNKDANLLDKVLMACLHPELSEWFVRLSDDQLILHPTKLADMRPLFGNELNAPRSKNDKWFKRFDNTQKLLKKAGYETRNYDNHAPMPVEKASFLRIAKEYDYQKLPGCTINTLYYNAYGKLQAVPTGTQAGIISGTMDEDKVRRMMQRFRYLGYTDKGLSEAFKTVLQETFPTPSRFEKP